MSPEDVNDDVCERLANYIVDSWDMETLVDYAITSLAAFFYDNKEAVIKEMLELEIEVDELPVN
jgi:hypothetical protein